MGVQWKKITELHAFPVCVDTDVKRVIAATCPYCGREFHIHVMPRKTFSRRMIQWAIRVCGALLLSAVSIAGWLLYGELRRGMADLSIYVIWGFVVVALGVGAVLLVVHAKSVSNWTLKTKLLPPGFVFAYEHVLLHATSAEPREGEEFTRLPSGRLLEEGLEHKWVHPDQEAKELWIQLSQLSSKLDSERGKTW